MRPQLKPKKCRICKAEFQPFSSTHVACGWECAIAVVEGAKEKRERKETREARARLKTRAQHLRDAQQAFNAFIRARDADLPCICCNRHHKGQYHAGHYLSVGARPELRFVENNVHKQASYCNNYKSGNQAEYRINLVKKIGELEVAWLEGPHDPKKYTVDEIKAIRAKYKAKLKELQR